MTPAETFVSGFSTTYQAGQQRKAAGRPEVMSTTEQVLSGVAVGLAAVTIGYAVGAASQRATRQPDAWAPLIGAGKWGGGAALCGVAVAVLSRSYRVLGVSTTVGSAGAFVAAASVWKRKYLPKAYVGNALGS